MTDQAISEDNRKSIYWICVLALFTAALANAVRAGAAGAMIVASRFSMKYAPAISTANAIGHRASPIRECPDGREPAASSLIGPNWPSGLSS